jgi:hypothetical protein
MKITTKTMSAMLFVAVAFQAQAATAVPAIIPVPSTGNSGAAPNGIAVSTSGLFFTQPYCAGQQHRGVYQANIASSTSTQVYPLAEQGVCAENYLAVSTGLGGFTAGDTYATGVSPTDSTKAAVFKNGSLFINSIAAPFNHAGITFDTTGTFGFNLIVTAFGSVMGYNSSGTPTFTYTGPSGYVLEGATVAPLTYALCPGCLFVTAELATNVGTSTPTGNGAIYYITPGTPSGSPLLFWSLTPGPEPEGIVFVGFNQSSSCAVGGYNYFVSGYATGTGQIDNPNSTSGAILGYTAAQLAPFIGQFLVPNEGSIGSPGVISAFSGPGVSTTFSTTAYQLEGSTIVRCPGSDGRMTGGGSVFEANGTRVTHGFELHCDVNDVPNRLEINWAGNRFHLETLISAYCFTDPNIKAGHPAAPFNTYVGYGIGNYNGTPGATAVWTFSDAGEPGTNDMATITIKDANGKIVLVVSGALDSGNQQAHKDNK